MTNRPESKPTPLPYSTPLTPDQVDAEKELNMAIAAISQIQKEIKEAEADFPEIKKQLIQIQADRDTYNQKRLQFLSMGESPQPWDEKLEELAKQENRLKTKHTENEDRIRELTKVRGYSNLRRNNAMAKLCAARQATLSDEINDILFELFPRLLEMNRIHKVLAMNVAPIIAAGTIRTLPSAKYPDTIYLKLDEGI